MTGDAVATLPGRAGQCRPPADALILAAGFGSRISALGSSKPLVTVAGIALLELGIRQAAAAGVSRVVVVTGHEAERVEAALPFFAARAGVHVEARRVEDWSRPNGWSVLAGASCIDGDYLLQMADHVFSGSILARLARRARAGHGVTLAVDRRIDSALVDPEDATWVDTRAGGGIRAIGKHLTVFDAVDCGAFLATPELAQAIGHAIAAGRPGSLSDGMQVLADDGRATTMDVGDAWWMDVDDPRAHRIAQAAVEAELPDIFGEPARDLGPGPMLVVPNAPGQARPSRRWA